MEIDVYDQVTPFSDFCVGDYSFSVGQICVVVSMWWETLEVSCWDKEFYEVSVPTSLMKLHRKGLKADAIKIGQSLKCIFGSDEEIPVKEIAHSFGRPYIISEPDNYWLSHLELVEEPSGTCSCDIMTLMQRGCTCGQMEREKCHT